MSLKINAVNNLQNTSNEFVILVLKEKQKVFYPDSLSAEKLEIVKNFLKVRPDILKEGKSETVLSFNGKETISMVVFAINNINENNIDELKMLGGNILQSTKKMKFSEPIVYLPKEAYSKNKNIVKEISEGILLADYAFDEYKSEKKINTLKEFTFVLPFVRASRELGGIRKNIMEVTIVSDMVNFARDLVNRPANDVTPEVLANAAKDMATKDLTCKILEKNDMKKLNMGALLSVAQGSEKMPKLIVLEYKGNPSKKEKIAFVGKGVTFDSGGISIKPADGMGEMKDDMAGAAAVLAAVNAIAKLKLPVNIIAVIPAVENMPSGAAARPGDVLKSAAGKTIEVISTDAEGRLILADSVWYADKKLNADYILDIATLTGAAIIALGDYASGIVTNNQSFCDKVLKAGNITGERCWQMPAFKEYKEYNKSDIADIKNSGGRKAGMITGGLFVGEFVGEKPWVHVDIGNTVSYTATKGYMVKGPSGVGVRLLVELAREFCSV